LTDNYNLIEFALMKKYEFINHTADLGLKIRGSTAPELFENAGWAMFDILVNLRGVSCREQMELIVESEGWDELLADWLRKLLSQFNGYGYIFKTFKVEKIDKFRLQATVCGEKLNLKKHRLKTEIKAVTYHGLQVKRDVRGWQAQVIFDI